MWYVVVPVGENLLKTSFLKRRDSALRDGGAAPRWQAAPDTRPTATPLIRRPIARCRTECAEIRAALSSIGHTIVRHFGKALPPISLGTVSHVPGQRASSEIPWSGWRRFLAENFWGKSWRPQRLRIAHANFKKRPKRQHASSFWGSFSSRFRAPNSRTVGGTVGSGVLFFLVARPATGRPVASRDASTLDRSLQLRGAVPRAAPSLPSAFRKPEPQPASIGTFCSRVLFCLPQKPLITHRTIPFCTLR
jgi:hypothetical protein